MRIAVVGVGCIGSVVAAKLSRAGHAVSLVARGKRGQQLREHGLRVRLHGSQAVDTYRLSTFEQVAAARDAELLLVCVQAQQVEALLPALVAHPAQRIAFLLNTHPVPQAWEKALGGRLVLGFPAMLAGYRGDVVGYRTLPGWLRFVMINTLGPVRGHDGAGARAVVALLNQAGLASTYHGDMESWLATHSALVTGLMAFARARLDKGADLRMTFRDALTVAGGVGGGLALVKSSGHRLTPVQLAGLPLLPSAAIASCLWTATQLPWFRQAVTDYVEHGADEVRALYEGLRTAGGARPSPNLDALCSAP
jgi:2-dehydropantoate 2-reductase